MQPVKNNAAQRWVQHVVRPLLRPTGSLCAAIAADANSDARRHRQIQGRAYTGQCFAGPEGMGCSLSEAEQIIANRLAKG